MKLKRRQATDHSPLPDINLACQALLKLVWPKVLACVDRLTITKGPS